jgi:hypothetical protein
MPLRRCGEEVVQVCVIGGIPASCLKNSAMKRILYLFVGLILGMVSVLGQGLPNAGSLPQQKLHLLPPPALTINGLFGSDTTRALVMTPEGPIRNLMPDHMPCLVPDLARAERMPMLRSGNRDAMPNGYPLRKAEPFYIRPGQQPFFKPSDK